MVADAEAEPTDTESGWALTRPVLGMHAVMGFVLFLATAPLLPGPSEQPANPETASTVAIGGAFLLGVLLVVAASLARRLAEHAAAEANLVPAIVFGLAGPLVFGLAGTAAWGLASFVIEREIGALIVLPGALTGIAAPAIALVTAALFLFERDV